MVDITTKRCAETGCKGKALYGVDAVKKREFCAKHAGQWIMNGKLSRCTHPGCKGFPSFGVEGQNHREFCAEHAEDGMIYMESRRSSRDQSGDVVGGDEGIGSTAIDHDKPAANRVSAGKKRRLLRRRSSPRPAEKPSSEGGIKEEPLLPSEQASSASSAGVKLELEGSSVRAPVRFEVGGGVGFSTGVFTPPDSTKSETDAKRPRVKPEGMAKIEVSLNVAPPDDTHST